MEDWRTLSGDDGTPLARYLDVARDGRRVADRLELRVPVACAVPAILAQLRGRRIAGSVELGRALLAEGATPGRHAHVMTHALRERPPLPDRGDLVAADRPAADLLPAFRAAHPPGHPDHDPAPEAHLAATLAGEAFGPLLDASGVALDAAGRVTGAVLVCAIPGDPPFNGPWVIECFRDPAHPGTGRALLERALHLAHGLPGLSLAVTDGNRAQGLYRALGFETVLTTLSVDLPPGV